MPTPFVPKTWENAPSTATPLDADGLNDLEDRISASFVGGSSALHVVERTVTETAGAGAYTATVVIPAGATVLDIATYAGAAFAGDTVQVDIGDSDGSQVWANYEATAGAEPPVDGVNGGGQNASNEGGSVSSNAWAGGLGGGKHYPAGTTITLTVTSTGAGGTTGRLRMLVIYAVPEATAAAVKS